MNQDSGLLSSLINGTNIGFTVTIEDKSIIHLAIALLIVIVLSILLWGLARKYS